MYVNLRIQLNIPVINMFGERFEQLKHGIQTVK